MFFIFGKIESATEPWTTQRLKIWK